MTTETTVREKPVLFNDQMVIAILDGRKSCTRRLVKHQPVRDGRFWLYQGLHYSDEGLRDRLRRESPWKVGDRLWVRECWADTNGESGPMVSYRAGGDRFLIEESYPVDYSLYPGGKFTMWCGDLRRGAEGHAWKPSIHMPRWASRLNLTVTAVEPMQIQDMGDVEASQEGVTHGWPISPHRAFVTLWQSLYPGSWDRNDWVYANEFEIERTAQ